MSDNDRVIETFSRVLGLQAERITDDLRYATIPEWDSIAHMSVIAALEDAFGIMIDMDDVIDISSVGKAPQIIAKYSPTG